MPKIQGAELSPALRHHLFDRFKQRQITKEDLFALEEWKRRSPDSPEGKRYKDFGTFKICGEGKYPKTFLLKGQAADGDELE